MKYLSLLIFSIILFQGCTKENKTIINPQQILENKCAKCHNLSMPPKIIKNELAPPMMAVTFHLKDYMKTLSQSEHKIKFSNFVADYILNPAVEKSYCDKVSIEKYGLMPSMKNEISKDEAISVANHIFEKYDANEFYKKQKEKQQFESLPKGEQIAKMNSCMSCHSISGKKIAPSFIDISKHSNKEEILNALKNGSRGKYKEFNNLYMPPLGKNMDKKDLDELIKWIEEM